MRIKYLFNNFLIASLFIITTPSWAMYVCTNSSGETSFQDMPCPSRVQTYDAYAVKTSELNKKVALKTFKNLNTAFSKRNFAAVDFLLTKDFEVKAISDKSTLMELKAEKYRWYMERTLDAIQSSSFRSNCSTLLNTPSKVILSCEQKEQLIFLKRKQKMSSQQVVFVELEDGYAKVSKLLVQSGMKMNQRWLEGRWELAHDPDGSPKDYLDFSSSGAVMSLNSNAENPVPGWYYILGDVIKITYFHEGRAVKTKMTFKKNKDTLYLFSNRTLNTSEYKKTSFRK